ncbi:rod-binding protein [Alkalimonas mucilaginosa]|uniref:Rod-binding protein n=1 Tax=Alkalimonas mucilaginosa TaxID=3057676 RepID=A0ABU7JEJ0_9GAMM|nr:rod-binding protein [Alkalimonas sp. MEB004]MEE2024037.1 rod-binding protein [Alkalimonas sp. MEB004]
MTIPPLSGQTQVGAALAIDPRAATAIDANQSPAERLNKAAEQFEAIFLQLVLKKMHAGTDAMAGEHGLFSSKEAGTFREMHDAQLAQSLAANQQLGLAEAIVRQLGEGLSQTENKFKQLAEAVALPEKEVLSSTALKYTNSAFSQPLWPVEKGGKSSL